MKYQLEISVDLVLNCAQIDGAIKMWRLVGFSKQLCKLDVW